MPNVDASQEGRRRLAEHMEARRKQLRLRWLDVASSAGLAIETLNAVRRVNDSGIRDLTLRAIDDGLQWQPGSAERILAGGEPAIADGQGPAGQSADGSGSTDDNLRDMRQRIADLEQLFMAAAGVDSPDGLDAIMRLRDSDPVAFAEQMARVRENLRQSRESARRARPKGNSA